MKGCVRTMTPISFCARVYANERIFQMKSLFSQKSLVFVATTLMAQTTWAAACKLDPTTIEKGKAAYKTATCNLCHGDQADGKGIAAAGLNPKPRNFLADKLKHGEEIEKIFDVTTNGLKGTTMVGYAHVAEADRCAISNYIFSLRAPLRAKK